MLSIRATLLSLACTLPVCTASFAAPVVAEATADPAQLAESAARKGTRNYRPGEDPTTAVPSDPTPLKQDGLSPSDKLTQCMETWDAGTHITKSKWREICKRQLSDQ